MALFVKKTKKNRKLKSHFRSYSGTPFRNSGKKSRGASRFLFWLLLLAFFGVLAYLFIFSPQMDMVNVVIEGNQDVSTAEISAEVNKTVAGKYLNLFSKQNFFFLKKRKIADSLEENFNRLEVISIEKKFPDTLRVTVEERHTELVWCSGGVCYSIDKKGLAFAGMSKSADELQSDKFLTVIDDNAKPVTIGETALHEEYVEYLKQLDFLLKEGLRLEIDGFYHTPALASQEIFVKIKEQDSEGWLLKLQSTVPVEETKRIIQTVFEKNLDVEKRKNLEYLDLRVKGKVYYRLR